MKILTWLVVVMLVTTNLYAMELKASWYSVESLKHEGTYAYSHGLMANGNLFSDKGLTCATRDFPLGARLKVTNKANHRVVYVVVTDRINKRFKGKRIDLSMAAFQRIADLDDGVISVIVER